MTSSSMSASGDLPAPSQSSIVADTVSGSHVLTIHGYSKTKGLGTGKSIASSPFDAAGHTWVIEYYPDGFDDSSADCISIFLRLADIHAKVNARYKLSLLDETGEPAFTMHSQGIRLFSRWGFNRFIERKNFERQTRSGWWRWTRNNNSLTYLKNGSFRVRCDITVLKEIRTEDVTVRSSGVVVPPSDIGQQLGCLLESGVGADVQFDVAGETFAAHKCILAARSPVFMAELFGPMKEKTESCVRIDDMEARVFKAFLHFIYNDSLPNIDKGDIIVMAQHILVAANRYSLDRLKLVCEDKLCRYIEADTVAKTLVLAEQHDCDMLKESCFQFLRSHGNLKAAMASDGFDHLTSSCPPIVKELLAKVSTDLSPLGSRKN